MSKKPKISAEVSAEEFDAYKVEATRQGMNLSEWIRRALNGSVSAKAPAVANEAFDQLDRQDANGGVMAEAVVPPPVPVPLQVLPKPPPAPIDLHPCVNLDPKRPGVLTSGECSGTCMASAQRGKPCFFGPMNARSCAHFLTRAMPAIPVQNARLRR